MRRNKESSTMRREQAVRSVSNCGLDIIEVMMTPWNADPSALRAQTRQMPKDLVQALSLTLDWALLASYRVAFETIEHRNQLADAAAKLARAAQQTGDASLELSGMIPRPISPPTVIAPASLMPLEDRKS